MKRCVCLFFVLSVVLIFNVTACKKSEIQPDGVTITVHNSTAERNGTGINYSLSFSLSAAADGVSIRKVYIDFYCNGTVTEQNVYEAGEILDTTYLAPGAVAHSHQMNFRTDDRGNVNTSVTVAVEYLDSDGEKRRVKLDNDISPLADTPVIEYFNSNGHYMSPGDTLILEWRVENADEVEIIWDTGERKVEARGQVQLNPYDGGESPCCYVLKATNKNGENTADIVIFLE